MKIMQCAHCGNQVLVLHDAGVPMVCCGDEMQEVAAGVTDAAQEKHVPAVQVDGTQVDIYHRGRPALHRVRILQPARPVENRGPRLTANNH